MRTNLREPRTKAPLDPSIGRHSIGDGELTVSIIWLGFYGMILCAALVSKFSDQISEVIALAGLN